MENNFELTFDKKKACIYELDKAATEVGNILGEAVKAAHIQHGITKEEFWGNLFITTGTGWNAKGACYSNNMPLKDFSYSDPQQCPADPYREMDLHFWIKYLLEGGSRVVSEENSKVCYAEDSLSFFKFFGLDCCCKGEYPYHRILSGGYRDTLLSLKTMRNSYVGHVSSKRIEEASLKTLQKALDTLFKALDPMCCKNWAGKKYAIAWREAAGISFYNSLQEVPYTISEMLSAVNLEPEQVDLELFAKAGIRTEGEMIYLNCDPVYFANMVKSLVQMDVPEEMWIMQLRRTQERTVDEKELMKLSDINEVPLSSNDSHTDITKMTPEELLERAMAGDINAQVALAEYCKNSQNDNSSAFRWWYRAAESGHALAQYQVGLCLLNGVGIVQNVEEAVSWFQKAVEQGNVQAQYQLGLCYADGIGVTKDPFAAMSWFHRAAEQGYAPAQFRTGFCWKMGLGTNKDLSKAQQWYRLAAEQGNHAAQNNLAEMMEKGTAGKKDLQAAFEWFSRAAQQGNLNGMWNVGRCYANGIGTEKNMKDAVAWYRKAAELGQPEAQYQLGRCYYFGCGIEKNLQDAVLWYQKAAFAGNASAQWWLGYCYANGIGTQQDYEKAANWYKEAAEQGNADAQCCLGVLYINGTGVPQNNAKAAQWYRKSAIRGCVAAQSNLAGCYEKGIGISKNLEDAMRWTKKVLECSDAKLVKKAQERYDRLSRMLAKNG